MGATLGIVGRLAKVSLGINKPLWCPALSIILSKDDEWGLTPVLLNPALCAKRFVLQKTPAKKRQEEKVRILEEYFICFMGKILTVF